LCISGGIECKRQPQIKIDAILKEGAAADDPRLQVWSSLTLLLHVDTNSLFVCTLVSRISQLIDKKKYILLSIFWVVTLGDAKKSENVLASTLVADVQE
jgi:hypothetical protein